MKKHIVPIIAGIAVVCFIGLSIFFALQGISTSNKKQAYFDAYREQAKEYVQSSPEIVAKYREGNIDVKFDSSFSYYESGRGFLDKYIELFNPKVPDTLEEFSKNIESVTFTLTVNGDPYEITFEQNSSGTLTITELVEITD